MVYVNGSTAEKSAFNFYRQTTNNSWICMIAVVDLPYVYRFDVQIIQIICPFFQQCVLVGTRFYDVVGYFKFSFSKVA